MNRTSVKIVTELEELLIAETQGKCDRPEELVGGMGFQMRKSVVEDGTLSTEFMHSAKPNSIKATSTLSTLAGKLKMGRGPLAETCKKYCDSRATDALPHAHKNERRMLLFTTR